MHIKPETVRAKAEQKRCWKEFSGEEQRLRRHPRLIWDEGWGFKVLWARQG